MRKFRIWLACVPLLASASAQAAQLAVQGPPDAPVSIVVFSALTCAYCAEGRHTLAQLQAKYPGKIRVSFKHFPLGKDVAARLPHLAAQAAAEQGQFWAMHDALFDSQAQVQDRQSVLALAAGLKLDKKRFAAALDSPSVRDAVDADVAEAQAFKVGATPTFYIDGYKFEGLHPPAAFEKIIEYKLGPAVPSAGERK